MSLTPAERKANQIARNREMMDSLVSTNAALIAENVKMRAELEMCKEKVHKMELAALKLQLRAKG